MESQSKIDHGTGVYPLKIQSIRMIFDELLRDSQAFLGDGDSVFVGAALDGRQFAVCGSQR